MDITSYLLGKNSGGGGDVTLQDDKAVTITSNGTTVVNPDEGYDGLKKATITTNVQPNLEAQTVTISTNTTTTITPTQGKDGLSSVEVITNVPIPGAPTKGIILSDWDNDGYPTKAEIVGLTQIPNYYLSKSTNNDGLLSKARIYLPNNITSIGWGAFSYLNFSQITLPNTLVTISPNAFQNCKNLTSITIPNSVTTLGKSAFSDCSMLTNVTLSQNITTINEYLFYNDSRLETVNFDNITASIGNQAFIGCLQLVTTKLYATTVGDQCFYNCKAIKKLCLPNLVSVTGSNINLSSFRNCTSLKQVWIGSNIATNGLQRYAFVGDNSLEKIYINLPRATVEAMAGYSNAFMDNTSKVGIIVCNDDAGFITEQEFDALVIN